MTQPISAMTNRVAASLEKQGLALDEIEALDRVFSRLEEARGAKPDRLGRALVDVLQKCRPAQRSRLDDAEFATWVERLPDGLEGASGIATEWIGAAKWTDIDSHG